VFEEFPHYHNTYEFIRELIRPTTEQMLVGIEVNIPAHKAIVQEWMAKRLRRCRT